MSKVSLYDLEYVIFDFETTGLNADQGDEIIEIGALLIRGDQPTDQSFHTLIDIKKDVPEQATAVHGITSADLKGQPTIEEAFPKFLDFLGNKMLIAHNAGFDLNFVKKNLKRFPHLSFANSCLDTLALSKQLFSYERRHNLGAIASRFEIRSNQDRHRSIGDCLLTAKVFAQMLQTLKRRRSATLGHIKSCVILPPKITQHAESLNLF
jgi:DNA polymerase III subunit epsilon